MVGSHARKQYGCVYTSYQSMIRHILSRQKNRQLLYSSTAVQQCYIYRTHIVLQCNFCSGFRARGGGGPIRGGLGMICSTAVCSLCARIHTHTHNTGTHPMHTSTAQTSRVVMAHPAILLGQLEVGLGRVFPAVIPSVIISQRTPPPPPPSTHPPSFACTSFHPPAHPLCHCFMFFFS